MTWKFLAQLTKQMEALFFMKVDTRVRNCLKNCGEKVEGPFQIL